MREAFVLSSSRGSMPFDGSTSHEEMNFHLLVISIGGHIPELSIKPSTEGSL
jgi:hypothetical protein